MSSPSESNHICPGCLIAGCVDVICWAPGKINRWLEQSAKPLAPLFLRLLLAYEFGEAGWEKLGGDNWFAEMGFPFPFNLLPAQFNWQLALWLEIIAPIALIVGFMTRFFSAALAVLTIVAITTAHWPAEWHTLTELWQGYSISDKGFGNYKLPLMYLFMLGSLTLSGSGLFSVDVWLQRRTLPVSAEQ
ncbi:DoxX family protein [Methylomonas koyamae]|uniref:HvfX family Cu-binding RiPP maturation protein n=1 Tax=Methylomonas koyamae TaxID=702114 RepID=UPI0009EF492E|nr:DoxX family protein [Methylomonas koyamae]